LEAVGLYSQPKAPAIAGAQRLICAKNPYAARLNCDGDATMSLAERVRVQEERLLSDQWSVLKTTRFDYLRRDGRWQSQQRETYDRGDGAAILLYDQDRRTVVLTRQFRYPCFVNGHGELMIEVPAGALDAADPGDCVRAEAEQEAGYRVRETRKVFEAFMSPGAVTERLHFFVAEVVAGDRIGHGGGVLEEGEDIEVFEIGFDDAMAMVARGEILDAKTIMLLQWAALHLFA